MASASSVTEKVGSGTFPTSGSSNSDMAQTLGSGCDSRRAHGQTDPLHHLHCIGGARMPEAVIVATARTPIGRANKGSLTECRPDDLSALIIKALLAKLPSLDPQTVED